MLSFYTREPGHTISKARNPDALHKAMFAIPPSELKQAGVLNTYQSRLILMFTPPPNFTSSSSSCASKKTFPGNIVTWSR